MSASAVKNLLLSKYYVESVEKTDPPDTNSDANWYRYVIGRGTSKIAGMRPGNLTDVTQHAESIAEDLNSRVTNTSATYAPRKQKL